MSIHGKNKQSCDVKKHCKLEKGAFKNKVQQRIRPKGPNAKRTLKKSNNFHK